MTAPVVKRRKRGKRLPGEGSIYQRTEDGLWVGSIMVGRRPNGRPDRRVVYGKTAPEVQGKLDELKQRMAQGLLGSPTAERQTVGVFLQRWLETARPSIRPSTWTRYESLTRLHAIPALGHLRLTRLRPDHVQALYASKLGAGLAPRSVRQLHAVLHRALGQALKWGLVPRNVADAVDPPAISRAEMQSLPPAQVALLADSSKEHGDRLAALWVVAFYSGLRQGELLGLKWSDLDLGRGTVTVKRALVGVSRREPQFGEPKTSRSRRKIKLPPEAIAALRSHAIRQKEERLKAGGFYAGHDLVFASQIGTPLIARNVVRSFKAALRRAGVPDVRFHDLRHTAATVMLSAGVHPKVVSERLGHSSSAITMDLYSHVLEELDSDAAERMERAVRGPLSQSVLQSAAAPEKEGASDH